MELYVQQTKQFVMLISIIFSERLRSYRVLYKKTRDAWENWDLNVELATERIMQNWTKDEGTKLKTKIVT